MSQKTYMYDTQWQALINAISGGDPTAIVTALGDIKNSIDTIETALGSLSADVTQDSTQWTTLINAISSGGGGGGGTIDIDATQWSNLLTEIGKGDMSATATALNNIYTRLNTIGFNSTQWTNLVNAITNQSLTVDLSNVTSSVVTNLSNVLGSTVTDAINKLNSDLASKINDFTYFGVANGSTLFNLPSIWKELYLQVNMRSSNICTTHLYNVQTSVLANTSLGNFGTSYAIGKLSKTQYQLSAANWGGTDVTSEAKTFIYYR